jgi:hypothetical protein
VVVPALVVLGLVVPGSVGVPVFKLEPDLEPEPNHFYFPERWHQQNDAAPDHSFKLLRLHSSSILYFVVILISFFLKCLFIQRFATRIIGPWETALKSTADCQPPLSGLISTMQTVQSALKFSLLTKAISCTTIFIVAIRGAYVHCDLLLRCSKLKSGI